MYSQLSSESSLAGRHRHGSRESMDWTGLDWTLRAASNRYALRLGGLRLRQFNSDPQSSVP